jgi:hypothetical protein
MIQLDQIKKLIFSHSREILVFTSLLWGGMGEKQRMRDRAGPSGFVVMGEKPAAGYVRPRGRFFIFLNP